MQESSTSKAEFPQLKPLGRHADKPPIPIHRPVFVIGSRQSAHLHLLSRQVDKAHAVILKDEQGLYIRDLCSRTHLLVNGQAETEAWLRDGDQIKIGPFVFRVLAQGFDEGTHQLPPEGRLEINGRDSVDLESRVVLIGRRAQCDVPVENPEVSAEHAAIFSMNERWYVRDLGSRAGTLVNGQPIHQKELSAGDELRVGTQEMRFVPPAGIPDEASAPEVEELDRLLAAEIEPELEPEPKAADEQAEAPEEEESVTPDEPEAPADEPSPAAPEEEDLGPLEIPDESLDDVLASPEPADVVPAEPPQEKPPEATAARTDAPEQEAEQDDLIHFEDEDASDALLIDDNLDVRKPEASATQMNAAVEPPIHDTPQAPQIEQPPDEIPLGEFEDEAPGDAEVEDVEASGEPLSYRGWRRPLTASAEDEPDPDPETEAEEDEEIGLEPETPEATETPASQEAADTIDQNETNEPDEAPIPLADETDDLPGEQASAETPPPDEPPAESPPQPLELTLPPAPQSDPAADSPDTSHAPIELILPDSANVEDVEEVDASVEPNLEDSEAEIEGEAPIETEDLQTTPFDLEIPQDSGEAEDETLPEDAPPSMGAHDDENEAPQAASTAEITEIDLSAEDEDETELDLSGDVIDLSDESFDPPVDDAQPLVDEPMQESTAGEIDFSNLKLDLSESSEAESAAESPDFENENDLGLELLDESDDPPPAEVSSGPESEEDLSLLSLDALEDALADSHIPAEAPEDVVPPADIATAREDEPKPEAVDPAEDQRKDEPPEKAEAPTSDSADEADSNPPRTPPLRGPDGRFIKRRDSAARRPKPAIKDRSDDAPPPPPPPAASANRTPADDGHGGIHPGMGAMGMGANQGGFFGGVPMGLEDEAADPEQPTATATLPPPLKMDQIPPPFAQPASPMQHPFDWNVDEIADADLNPQEAPRRANGRLSTGFDGLAMPPVRQTDVFSQMAAGAAAEALLHHRSVQDSIPPMPPQAKEDQNPPPMAQRAPVSPGWRAPTDPPPRRRRYGWIVLLVLMLACMAAAVAGIWWFVHPQTLVQGVLPFNGPQPTAYQQQQQIELLKDPHTLQAARTILQDEHVGGGFLNDAKAYAKFTADAQWSADGLMLTRTGQDRRDDQARVAALLTALYRSPANQALVDHYANLKRQLEDQQSAESIAKGTFNALDQQVQSLERNPPLMPTPQARQDIDRKLAALQKAMQEGQTSVRISAGKGLIAAVPSVFESYLSQSNAGESADGVMDVRTAYSQMQAKQQAMQAQLEAARQFERQLQDRRKQRRAAEVAAQEATHRRLDAQHKLAAVLAPTTPKPPTAITLGDSRPMNTVAAVAIIAIIFMFLILLMLLVGRESVAPNEPALEQSGI